jgi:lysophospholipase L1-like esterase
MNKLPPVILLGALAFAVCGAAFGQAFTPLDLRDGLPNVAKKLRAGDAVSVVFLGGSITKGGGDHGFTEAIPAWLRREFPESEISHFNAGINGTDSDFGAARADRDVIARKPDLVFVEFAVNDGQHDRTSSMERIVRKIWTDNPATDIVFLYTLTEEEVPVYEKGELPPAAGRHEKVASHYGIPSVVLAASVIGHLQAGGEWKEIMRDGCHPTDKGYALYEEQIKGTLTSAFQTGQAGRSLRPDTLVANLKLYPDPIAAKPMPNPVPLQTPDGRIAAQTFELPAAGEYWRQEPEFKVEGKNLWALYAQPFQEGETRNGGNLDAGFGLNRKAWTPMRWLEERGAFDGPEGMPLWSGKSMSARENDLPVIVFIAPETGRYAFELRSEAVAFNSHHKQLALNVVKFPWGKPEGESIAFYKTDSTEKKTLLLTGQVNLQAGEMVALCLDTNVPYGGGAARLSGLTARFGLYNNE